MLCTLIVAAGLHAADYKDVPRTALLNRTGTVNIETFKGSIRIGTWDRPKIDIQARIEADGASSLDRRRFERTQVSIDASADYFLIRTRYPDGSCCDWRTGNKPYVSYTIRMPRSVSLCIRDRRSDTEINGLVGPLDFDTHGGSAAIEFASFSAESHVDTHAPRR
jgi:hypothetical protein